VPKIPRNVKGKKAPPRARKKSKGAEAGEEAHPPTTFSPSEVQPTPPQPGSTPDLKVWRVQSFPRPLFIDPRELAKACETAPEVPSIFDLLTWQSEQLSNPHDLYRGIFPRLDAISRPPPQGFGLRAHRAILGTWHIREALRRKPPSEWERLGIAALDVVSNAIAVWRFFPCAVCGRAIDEHGYEVMDKLRTTSQYAHFEHLKEFQIPTLSLCVLECGFALRIPGWFEEVRQFTFPHSPETSAALQPFIRRVSREYLWSCLGKLNDKGPTSAAFPEFLRRRFRLLIPRKYTRELKGGEAIRELTTEIERGFERMKDVGISGVGMGALLHKGAFVLAVA
jgi:hypothetical protein